MHSANEILRSCGSPVQLTVNHRMITSAHQLPDHLCPDPQVLMPVVQSFPMRITPYFVALIKGHHDALARQVIPDPLELKDPCLDDDPLAEEMQSPSPLIIHR